MNDTIPTSKGIKTSRFTATRLRRVLARTILLVISTVVAFGAAELLLRGYVSLSSQSSSGDRNVDSLIQVVSDDRAYALRPSREAPLKTNSLGFRGDEVSAAKSQGVRRIAMLGDSITFGNGVRWNETFSYRLQQDLNSNLRINRWEVLNLGVSGYNTHQELAALRHVGLPLSPDLVVLNICLNDSDPIKEISPAGLKNRTTISGLSDINLRTVVASSTLLTLIKKKTTRLVGPRSLSALNSPKMFINTRVGEAAWGGMKEAMAEIHETCNAVGIPLAVVIYPYRAQLSQSGDDRLPQSDLVAFWNNRKVPILDSAPVYQAADQDMFVDGYIHLSAFGHRTMAKSIHKFLETHGFLRPGGDIQFPAR